MQAMMAGIFEYCLLAGIDQLTGIFDMSVFTDRLKKGADFAALARELSLSEDNKAGGLMRPFDRDATKVPELMRQMAFAMKTVGEVSDPLLLGNSYHILKLEKIIEPKEPLAKVRGKIVKLLREEAKVV